MHCHVVNENVCLLSVVRDNVLIFTQLERKPVQYHNVSDNVCILSFCYGECQCIFT